ncbi:Major Facilitator Superfamily protein [Aspergillus parasiticus SU-1]|uniref:Citrate exporter 1 n=1 Tax=Aspergillus parasiticus (strain ATCC 56775 / NRRL 5862 / SRRC 143 / SU-1) TaxID=1403190 RepID=A0A0F0I1L6_ASPPU|nr:Major Facilitator Superfamily protein [Aspergillus parasiticus SU-1]
MTTQPRKSEKGPETTANDDDVQRPAEPPEAPYTILSETEKICTILIASFSGALSPISATIYFPALNKLADNLHVSPSKINLSITVYMVDPNRPVEKQIFQAVAPSFVGTYSDRNGRRPALLICFFISIAVNIGLALQNSYPALMVLRCLQSAGSSGTLVISAATSADMVVRSERGKYLAYSTIGQTVGQTLGPVIGGLLVHFTNTHSIFWFLASLAGFMALIVVVFLRETCRNIVGNGSIPPQKWNRRILDIARRNQPIDSDGTPRPQSRRRYSPLETLKICREKETAIILVFISFFFCGFTAILSTLPAQLEKKYGFNSLQIGLCCLPYAFGTLTSRWTVGYLTDWNFRRHANRLGLKIAKNRQTDLAEFPAETARLQLTLPLVYLSAIFMITYSWVMASQTNLAGPLIMIFLVGHTMSAGMNTLMTLLVDCHVQRPATAIAASNILRFPMAAGVVAAATPLINAVGIGWAGTVLAFIWIVYSPLLWVLMKWGHDWRREELKKRDQASQKEKEPIL